MLGAGAIGVQENHQLKSGNCVDKTAAELGEEGRRALGITERMSLTWEEARKAFAADDVVRKVLGSDLADKYLSVNEVSVSYSSDCRGCFFNWICCSVDPCEVDGG